MRAWPQVKAFWGLFWRMVLLTPVVMVFGTVLFGVVVVLMCLPVLAIGWAIFGEYWWALGAIAVWVPWLKFGGRMRRFVFEGFENGGL